MLLHNSRQHMVFNVRFALLCLMALGTLSSCSSKVGFTFGPVTSRVEGTISFDAGRTLSQPFVLVKKFHRTFMESSAGHLHSVSADLILPDEKGEYRVDFEADVDRLELFFFAKGHRAESESFARTLGIGSYRYDVVLKPDSMFRESFYLSIKPTLSEFIVEPRYKMPQNRQMFLANWFRQIEEEYPPGP